MSTQEQDTFATGGRGIGSTIAALNPASNGDAWVALQSSSSFAYDGTNSRGSASGSTTANLIVLQGSVTGADGVNYLKKWYDHTVSGSFQKADNSDDLGVIFRAFDQNNYYYTTVNNGNFVLKKVVGGVTTQLGSIPFADGGAEYSIKAQISGFGLNGTVNNIQARVWLSANAEPSTWNFSVGDGALTKPGYSGLRLKGGHSGSVQYVYSFLAVDGPVPNYNPTNNASSMKPYGATIFVTPSNPPALSQQIVSDVLAAFGVGAVVRYQLQWKSIELFPGTYAWAMLDDAVARLNNAGLVGWFSLAGAPNWYLTVRASDGATVAAGTGQLPGVSAISSYGATVAARYNGGVNGFLTVIQVENELYDSQTPRDIQSQWLVAPQKACYSAIKAASPTTLVASCAVRKTPNAALTHITNWMTNLFTYSGGVGSSVDILDFHYYRGGSSAGPDPTTSDANTPDIATELSTIQNIAAQYGRGGIAVVCGEFGWDLYHSSTDTYFSDTSPVTQAQDRDYSWDMYDRLRRGFAAGGYRYTLNPTATVSSTTLPFSATDATPTACQVTGETKSWTQTISSVYTYMLGYSDPATGKGAKEYAAQYPYWHPTLVNAPTQTRDGISAPGTARDGKAPTTSSRGQPQF